MPILTRCSRTRNSQIICTVVEEWTHGYLCLGCFTSSTHFDLVIRLLRRCGGSVFWFFAHDLGFRGDKNAVAIVESVSQWVVCHEIQMHRFSSESLGETRCRNSWNQFRGYDSQSLRYVKQIYGKRKDHRWEKYKSNLNISEAPTL